MQTISRRQFVASTTATATAAAALGTAPRALARAPAAIIRRAGPIVVASANGNRFKNGGDKTGVHIAFEMITQGADALDAVIAGVNLCELDPEDASVGYGGLPNADGVVQLDSCCMHGPLKRAGGVACLEGVRTPSKVARAVLHQTDHHLIVGKGAQDLARGLGFEIEADLNTERSRTLWLEWKRRTDPEHYLDPEKRETTQPVAATVRVGDITAARSTPGFRDDALAAARRAAGTDRTDREDRGWQAALSMVRDGLIDPEHLFGTINMNAISPAGAICGVTTTSGLAWKIPGRVGDSPILGAGLYMDNDIGAAGSTGRGEANLYNLCSFLIVENMRRGMSPKDAGMEALKRVQTNTIEKRLLNPEGNPSFGLNFYVLNAAGEYAGVSMFPSKYAVCTENGPETVDTEALLPAPPRG